MSEVREGCESGRFISVHEAAQRSGLRPIEIDELCMDGVVDSRLWNDERLLVSVTSLDTYLDNLPSGAHK